MASSSFPSVTRKTSRPSGALVPTTARPSRSPPLTSPSSVSPAASLRARPRRDDGDEAVLGRGAGLAVDDVEDLLARVIALVRGDGLVAGQAARGLDGGSLEVGVERRPDLGGGDDGRLRPLVHAQRAVLVVQRGEEKRLRVARRGHVHGGRARRAGEQKKSARAGRGDERSREEERRDVSGRGGGSAREAGARTSASKPSRGSGSAAATRRTAVRRFSRALSSPLQAAQRSRCSRISCERSTESSPARYGVQPAAHLGAAVVPHVQGGVHGVPPWAAALPATLVAAAVPRTFSRSAARARDRRDMTVPIGTRRMVAISL